MFIPLDVLYDYLEHQHHQDFIIYRFSPHGSKNIKNLVPKRDYTIFDTISRPILICHDQEPLNWNEYGTYQLQELDYFDKWPGDFKHFWLSRNLRSACEINIYDKCIITHSEFNSAQVELYRQNGFEPVYFWSHALLARDWYRYAMLDPKLVKDKKLKFDFNLYARAWSGSREYRLYFLSLLQDIAHNCRVTFSVHDHVHYLEHKFVNAKFDIQGQDLENSFGNTEMPSYSSASYDADHYHVTMIDCVLETLCDDQRIHLTEKTLRPIACGQPFVLAAPAQSLSYLRGYGFKTFSPWIDESYDTIDDPVKRLRALANEMQRISRLSLHQKAQLQNQLQDIAKFNQQHFFGLEFFNQVINEYIVNVHEATRVVLQSKSASEWYQYLALYDRWPEYRAHPDAKDFFAIENQVRALL